MDKVHEADADPSDNSVGGTTTFSASQILEAGRRAEAEGNRDHALRFYAHLTSQVGGSPEAAEAHAAIRRLEGRHEGHREDWSYGQPATSPAPTLVNANLVSGWAPAAHPSSGYASARALAATPLHGAPDSPGPVSLGVDRRPYAPAQTDRAAPAGRLNTENPAQARHEKLKGRKRSAASGRDRDETARAPRYLLGRFIAGLLILLGGTGTIAGVIALVASAFLPASRSAGTLISMVIVSPIVAGIFTLVSLIVLLLGHMAKAVFASAITSEKVRRAQVLSLPAVMSQQESLD